MPTYATDRNIADTEDGINMFSQQPNLTSPQYANELAGNALRCENVYEDHDPNVIFIKRLDEFICQSMRGHRGSR